MHQAEEEHPHPPHPALQQEVRLHGPPCAPVNLYGPLVDGILDVYGGPGDAVVLRKYAPLEIEEERLAPPPLAAITNVGWPAGTRRGP